MNTATTPALNVTASVVIPTLNAAPYLPSILDAIGRQQPAPPVEVILIDSGSTDNTRSIAEQVPGTRFETITDFSHGRARNRGAHRAKGDLVVFLSQDAVPSGDTWLAELVRPFADPRVAGVFSRQVPRADASPMERFFLDSHFPASGRRYEARGDSTPLQFATDVFFSNVSAAVRGSVLKTHPFDESLIMSEDQQFARDVLKAGHAVVYAAASVVTHSHTYTFQQTLGRYFDSVHSLTCIFPQHGLRESARIGGSYLKREAVMMLGKHPFRLPAYAAYVFAKCAGTVLGHHAHRMPTTLARRLSLHKQHWRPPVQDALP